MFESLKVEKIVKETPNAVSIQFEVNPAQQSFFKFKAGQFLTLKHDIDGQEVRRSYSLCSSPSSGELKVAIKKIDGGLFSSYAVDRLQEGEVIQVGAPAGKFTVECASDLQNKYVFITAGSGITPVMSMVKTILAEEPKSTVYLLYGNKTPEETIFLSELKTLEKTHSGRLNTKYFYSKSQGEDELTTGRISSEKITKLKEEWGDLSLIKGFYLCGPKALIDDARNTISSWGKAMADKIHFELFTTALSEQAAEVEENEEFDKAKVTVNVDEVDYTFEVKAGKEILAAGIAAGIDIPYSCQGGVCGSCECTVTEGKVEMKQNMILSEEEVEEGQALACQAVAKTSTVKLTFDY